MDPPERARFRDYALVAVFTLLVVIASPALVVVATLLYVATLAAFLAALSVETSRAVRAWSLSHRRS